MCLALWWQNSRLNLSLVLRLKKFGGFIIIIIIIIIISNWPLGCWVGTGINKNGIIIRVIPANPDIGYFLVIYFRQHFLHDWISHSFMIHVFFRSFISLNQIIA
jgi:hypothetical protein